jgi:hypothetical protein
MLDWRLWVWIGPLIAVLLALRLRPRYLALLGLTASAGFIAAFEATQKLYPDCLDPPGCPGPGEHRLSALTAILFLLAASLLLLALVKAGFNIWRRHHPGSGYFAKPS